MMRYSKHHLRHHQEYNRGQDDFQLVRFEASADSRADLGSHSRTNEQDDRQDEVDSVIVERLLVRDIATNYHFLEEIRSHHGTHGHSEQVHHHRHHDKSTADTKQRSDHSHQ